MPIPHAGQYNAPDASPLRHDWTRAELHALFALPLPELTFRAQTIHRQKFDPAVVQISTLLSIKTGGCPEDCAYCPQSASYDTGVRAEKLMPLDDGDRGSPRRAFRRRQPLLHGRSLALAEGARTRSGLRNGRGRQGTRPRDLRNARHAHRGASPQLRDAGLDYYNHNLDTSPEFYGDIISTRTYQDRLDTLDHVRAAGIQVCCGGIVGMGETRDDRVGMIATLANLPAHPEMGTDQHASTGRRHAARRSPPLDAIEFVRTIAVARITMPRSMVRLSAGREEMSEETQALCFIAGANSIFYGPSFYHPNPARNRDQALMDRLGLSAML